MLFLLVESQCRNLIAGKRAIFAFKGIFYGVIANMFDQLQHVTALIITEPALVFWFWFLFGLLVITIVLSLVNFKVLLAACGEVAKVALIVSLSCVCSFMNLQIRISLEVFIAKIALAQFFTRVHTLV